jgi:hypothetical protein
MARRSALVLTALAGLAAVPLAAASASCYYPNGDLASGDTPCSAAADGSATHATCCGQGYACMSNNMCKATGQEDLIAGASVYVRGSCTDKDWESGKCPQFCANGNSPYFDNMSGGNGIGICKGNKSGSMFYCLDSAKFDCEAGVNVLFYDGESRWGVGWIYTSG